MTAVRAFKIASVSTANRRGINNRAGLVPTEE